MLVEKLEITDFDPWKKEIENIKFKEAQDHSTLINLGFVDQEAQKYKDFSHATGETNNEIYEELRRLRNNDPTISYNGVARWLFIDVIRGLRKHKRKFLSYWK